RRSTSIVVRSAVKRCSSMKPSLMWALAWPNSNGNTMRGLCPRWDAQAVMATRWNMSIKRHSPPAGRFVHPCSHCVSINLIYLRDFFDLHPLCAEQDPVRTDPGSGCRIMVHDFCQRVTLAFGQRTHIPHDHHSRGQCYRSASISYDVPCMGAISYQKTFASALTLCVTLQRSMAKSVHRRFVHSTAQIRRYDTLAWVTRCTNVMWLDLVRKQSKDW